MRRGGIELLLFFILFTGKPAGGRAERDLLLKSEVCGQRKVGTVGFSQ